MLTSRVLQPDKSDIFYHYCSVETFMAIIENRTLRFSDANMMNDYAESSYGYRLFEDAATKILNDDGLKSQFSRIDVDFFNKVDEIISPLQLMVHPVLSCFSREPDVLSQWRQYADDGRGLSIGFSGEFLSNLPVTVLEVEYERERQIDEMVTALLAIYMDNVKSKSSYGQKFFDACFLLGSWKFGYKHTCFKDEREVRCLHLLDVKQDGETLRLFDAGGVASGKKIKGQKIQFRVQDGGIVAFIDMPFPKKLKKNPIEEIWMGPKNNNGIGNIIYYLSENSINCRKIIQSDATYR